MGNTWFQFKEFRINQDTTAMKVGVDSVLLGAWASFSNSKHILDIGAGTGLLSFMAEQKSNAKITAIEINKDAFEQCLENIFFNKKENEIKVINTSIQEFTESTNKIYDSIITNPPYFNNSYKSEINSRNIARHTEQLSHNELIDSVAKLLSFNGKFILILPFDSHESFIELAALKKLYCTKKLVVFPNERKDANRVILEFSKNKTLIKIEEIFIRNKDTNQYSEKYKELTKDFYLKG